MSIFKKFGHFLGLTTCSLKAVEEILGSDNVYPEEGQDSVSHYPIDIFRFCAEENSRGEMWRLVYKSQLTLLHIRINYPVELGNLSWAGLSSTWLDEKLKPGYRLLNFNACAVEAVEERKKALIARGVKCAPAKAATVVESLITTRRIRETLLLTNVTHCALADGIEGEFPVVTRSKDKILVHELAINLQNPRLPDCFGVVLCVEPYQRFFKSKTSTT